MIKLDTNIFLISTTTCQLLPTTYGLQQFAQIEAVKVDFLIFQLNYLKNLRELDARVIA